MTIEAILELKRFTSARLAGRQLEMKVATEDHTELILSVPAADMKNMLPIIEAELKKHSPKDEPYVKATKASISTGRTADEFVLSFQTEKTTMIPLELPLAAVLDLRAAIDELLGRATKASGRH